MGAHELAERAERVEHALREGPASRPPDLPTVLKALDTHCSALCDAIVLALPQAPAADPAGSRGPVDWGAARAVLDRMEALLADDDAQAIELFQLEAATLSGALGAHHALVARAMDGYDLEAALTALRAARRDVAALSSPLPQ